MDGLDFPVKITRDRYNVPHIDAESDHDAFFAMGFLHSQDRMWQMEYKRRLGQGRLSEFLGVGALDIDKLMRTLGLYRAAKSVVESLDERSLAALNAYVDGVNAGIEEQKILPVEYYLLGVTPEVWTPADSILQIKLMAFNLGATFGDDITYDLLMKELGVRKASMLFSDYPDNALTVTKVSNRIEDLIRERLLAINSTLEDKYNLGGIGLGSNGWVVSGKHTRSKKPILANDPHLTTEIPSVWYLAEINGHEINVMGATIPGLPFVVLGHNKNIAWGGTNLYADVQDIFIEKQNPYEEHKYLVEGEWQSMTINEEWIKIKSNFPSFLNEKIPPIKWLARSTRHGPLISDVIGNVNQPLALSWTALESGDQSFEGFLKINYASDWHSFKNALTNYSAPALNFIYADREGNIGYIAGGKIPVRNSGDGSLPVPGWDSNYDWHDYISIESLPQEFNPPSGIIITANNKVHDDEYPFHISSRWEPPYRAQRINEVILSSLDENKSLNVQQLVDIQGDVVSLQARKMISLLGNIKPKTYKQEEALYKIKHWDGSLDMDSEVATIYQSWLRNFYRLLLADDLKGELLYQERSNRLQRFLEKLQPLFIQKIFNEKKYPDYQEWCDNTLTYNKVESCHDLARQAFDEMFHELGRLPGDNLEWGNVHHTHYSHPVFSNIKILNNIFDREIESGGDGYSINVATWQYSLDKGYQQITSASYRQVIDLNDWNESRFIINTGQSANILSEHYDDYIGRHRDVELLPMLFNSEFDQGINSKLMLQPFAKGSIKESI
ncbi:penicillin acylase family protein [Microbulbifer epialgicus]|uniref:Penicillin acylase family protein n=1 Tax=Microbulbifer epialgicus TaxID=393907 RepID=A0ABV4P587_9GAMM